jgi:hypothetical protein
MSDGKILKKKKKGGTWVQPRWEKLEKEAKSRQNLDHSRESGIPAGMGLFLLLVKEKQVWNIESEATNFLRYLLENNITAGCDGAYL